ncbi:Por secretion system C-terminal sorting domain-containing protein [Chitinophaga costaii]|uniref:Por secretion system C-terminal sorting domain-containing protein n=1 Tax=Chitinophaga costaii TaxID=1335309 RepID=A0A1C4EC33_9BACT|nr:T9SS C-terminal target domain-containing protein [Chitinophaga costaii]SCC41186.1 Por secretion system C-terminal sorting domain-containing protein [Chitinophaga costaii]
MKQPRRGPASRLAIVGDAGSTFASTYQTLTDLRRYLFPFLSILCCHTVAAQQHCGSAVALQHQFQLHPTLALKAQQNAAMLQERLHTMRLQRTTATPTNLVVPVVIHIVLPDPSIVTAAQIAEQMQVLNEDFAGSNADTSAVPAVWKPLIGHTHIQFCLAQRTPGGDPATGVVRVASNHGSFDVYDAAAAAKYTSQGGSDAWDTDNYFNIWVCQLSSGNLGVATPPDGSFPAEQDGIVVDYTGFGSSGTAQSPYNGGRTVTHETGHYFGMKHIWGDDDGDGVARCTTDDGIDDTPLQGKRNFDCPTFPKLDACSPTSPGIMFMNYMDYTNDACMHLFTTDQAAYMDNVWQTLRTSLITSTGCQPVTLQQHDAEAAGLLSPMDKVCDNQITPEFILKNKGTDPLTSVKITYTINGGSPVTYNWTGNLASLATTTLSLPSSVVDTGHFVFTLYTDLPNGLADQDHSNDTARGSFHYDADGVYPMLEGFEGEVFPPDGWKINNPDNSFTWELTRDAAKSGNNAVVMRNLGYASNGPVDDLLTPVFNGGTDSVFLYFDIAAATQSDIHGTNTTWDTLAILVSKDCGLTYDSTGYLKAGATLVTRTTPVTQEYYPTASEWRRDSVNLTALVRNSRYQVVFRNISNYENNIYLDNINIVTKGINPLLQEKGILYWPNPTSGPITIAFYSVPTDLQSFAVYDGAGRLVMSRPASAIGSNNRITFDLVNEANGVYFVKLIYRDRKKTFKIVKVQ